MGRAVTDCQLALMAAIWDFTQQHGFPPTTGDLARVLGKHPATVTGHLIRAHNKGLVTWEAQARRTLRVIDPAFLARKCTHHPLGVVHEPAAVAAEVFAAGRMWRVAAPGLPAAAIIAGDWVVLAADRSAAPGDLVAWAIPGSDAVHVVYAGQPSEATASDASLVGVVVGVVRAVGVSADAAQAI